MKVFTLSKDKKMDANFIYNVFQKSQIQVSLFLVKAIKIMVLNLEQIYRTKIGLKYLQT